MKNTLWIHFFAILFFALFYQPAVVLSDAIFFDFNGNVIDKAKYEQHTSDREKAIGMELKNGYDRPANVWKDPVKLRKKRIEQWRTMRAGYHPDSLPMKIEKPSTKTN